MTINILKLAYERGRNGTTFATDDEVKTPGYYKAWSLGTDIRMGRCPESTPEAIEDYLRTLLVYGDAPTCDDLEEADCAPYDDGPDESMDGDHESALASCGWGTDEDYGCFDCDDGDW